jgi:hypothetical protein
MDPEPQPISAGNSCGNAGHTLPALPPAAPARPPLVAERIDFLDGGTEPQSADVSEGAAAVQETGQAGS